MHAQVEVAIECPYCGSAITVLVDPSVAQQNYIEDCEVCCQPMTLSCVSENDETRVEVRRGDE
ncbi:MAG: CPXCG motif-containing cysteine-rich protein [Gammaproteobacteria bacterium]